MQDTTTHQNQKAGQVEVREGKRGKEFWAYNLERGECVNIGTARNQVYETAKPIFQQRQTLNLTEAEFSAVLATGVRFINIVVNKSKTFSIEVERFARYAKPYDHPRYGRQMACQLKYFSFSNKTAPRNDRRDNPVVEHPGAIAPRDRQLQLFG